jgi:wyosine [tRNA(Phe)-imidazoG37] synthetase (radical SAM superfamily)
MLGASRGPFPAAPDHGVVMIAFGPIPSRRLGNSLGVNNIPPKHCSYSCVYCQAGPTERTETARCRFYSGEDVVRAVARKAVACWRAERPIDFISFVPDGEPTLDEELGLEIRGVKALGHAVAVITNGSLLGRADVRADLSAADLVSVKVDAGDERTWRRIDRPRPNLRFDDVQAGILEFARSYRGTLVTETMLVRGVNDGARNVERVGDFLERLAPQTAYLAVPTRPPTDARAQPPGPVALARACAILEKHGANVKLLAGEDVGSYAPTADPIGDLLAILAVHPMRLQEVEGFLHSAGLGRDVVDHLVAENRAKLVRHRRQTFLVGASSETAPPVDPLP